MLSLLLAGTAMTACSGSWMGPPACMPPKFSVTPSEAAPGATITVAAPDATCDPRYGHNASISIAVLDSSGQTVLNTTAPMRDAGSFSITFPLPNAVVPGKGLVSAYPKDIDWCDDTGRNNRAQGGPTTLSRASCAMPAESISVLP